MEGNGAAVPSVRDESGRFLKGVSGNPLGRPRHRHIQELQQDLEIAVRENLSPERVARILNKMADMAEAGSVSAAKLLLDKTISNAAVGPPEKNSGEGRTVVFRIVNATFGAPEVPKADVIDVTPTEVKTE